MAESDADVHQPVGWKGKNLLGFALLEPRARLSKVVEADRADDANG